MNTQSSISLESPLTIADAVHAAAGPVETTLPRDARARLKESHATLIRLAEKEVVYGVNTGFGPMANVYIAPEEQRTLQYNLVRSHAVGMGEELDPSLVRAIMLVRLKTLARGYSGVSLGVITQLQTFLKKDIVPVVYTHGSVGASGDLVQLAHVALALIGEGEVIAAGERMSAASALEKHGLTPLQLAGRDGLALINGTSAMTGIAAVTHAHATGLLALAERASAALHEIIGGSTEHISPPAMRVRPHSGQRAVATQLRALLRDAPRVRRARRTPVPVETGEITADLNDRVQEIYSIRCVPQILGPVHDELVRTGEIITTEMNAVTDNPIIDPRAGAVHAGNFHGDYISSAMDTTRIALTKLSLLLERQLNFLVNDRLNGILPPYINAGTPGRDLALQGLQFVATSNAAENQTLATPVSIHTIPTNNDNQDVVSMGTNAAMLTNRVTENTYEIMAILCTALAQAVDVLDGGDALGESTSTLYQNVRSCVPMLSDDRVLSREVAALTALLKEVGHTEVAC